MRRPRHRHLWLGLAIAVAGAAPACAADPGVTIGQRPQPFDDRYAPAVPGFRVTTWVTRLDTPWSLVFVGAGKALVSERRGAVRVIEDNRLLPTPIAVRKVVQSGEGGLMGLALHPRFPSVPFLYAMETVEERGRRENRVVRFRYERNQLEFDRVVIGGIPAGANHNGGRIAFGPDRRLYVTTGDTFRSALAQDRNSLAGKILRLADDGSTPPDNPVLNSPIYSLGHRNGQGLAWDPQTGKLLEAEHGPSGEFGLSAWDEINVIEPNGNFGWPQVVGAAYKGTMIDPIVAWPDDTTAPSGMAFWHGDLFVATLRAQALVRVTFERDGDKLQPRVIERWFAKSSYEGRFGRLRDAAVGPDNALYVLTSNRDGRGNPAYDDDKIIKIEVLGR